MYETKVLLYVTLSKKQHRSITLLLTHPRSSRPASGSETGSGKANNGSDRVFDFDQHRPRATAQQGSKDRQHVSPTVDCLLVTPKQAP